MLASYRGHVETVLILLDPKYHTDVNVTTEVCKLIMASAVHTTHTNQQHATENVLFT